MKFLWLIGLKCRYQFFDILIAVIKVRGLDDFSHVWIVFVFHEQKKSAWRPTVRPPRLGGNTRVGVFASRSPFRPNPIGLSSARLKRIDLQNGKTHLHLTGVDILDGTPVLDIKPYVPWADRLEIASGGYAADAPQARFNVRFTQRALSECEAAEKKGALNLQRVIRQALSHDTRPAYYENRSKKKQFGTRIYNMEVKWKVADKEIIVYTVNASENRGTLHSKRE